MGGTDLEAEPLIAALWCCCLASTHLTQHGRARFLLCLITCWDETGLASSTCAWMWIILLQEYREQDHFCGWNWKEYKIRHISTSIAWTKQFTNRTSWRKCVYIWESPSMEGLKVPRPSDLTTAISWMFFCLTSQLSYAQQIVSCYDILTTSSPWGWLLAQRDHSALAALERWTTLAF